MKYKNKFPDEEWKESNKRKCFNVKVAPHIEHYITLYACAYACNDNDDDNDDDDDLSRRMTQIFRAKFHFVMREFCVIIVNVSSSIIFTI